MCTKCCFLYTGPLRIRNSAKWTSKATVYPIHDRIFGKLRYYDPTYVTRFMFEIIFGEIYSLNKLVRTCDEDTCGNIYHLKFKYNYSLNAILQNIGKCEHGSVCQECCWTWERFTRKRTKNNEEFFSIEPGKKMIRRILSGYILGKHLNRYQWARTTCKNAVCTNWNHISIEDNKYTHHIGGYSANRSKAINDTD